MNTGSKLVKNQKKHWKKTIRKDGKIEGLLRVTVRHDDECGNGHNTFAITAEYYNRTDRIPREASVVIEGQRYWLGSCGQLTDLIREHFPRMRDAMSFHLRSTDGPLHYIANTLYYARPIREFTRFVYFNVPPMQQWQLLGIFSDSEYCQLRENMGEAAEYLSEKIEAGRNNREADYDAAKRCAIWPEATNEELASDDLEDRLRERHPELMRRFREVVESFGFTY